MSISWLMAGMTASPPATDRPPAGSAKSFWTSTMIRAVRGPYRCMGGAYLTGRQGDAGTFGGGLSDEGGPLLGGDRRDRLGRDRRLDVEQIADALERLDASGLSGLRAELPAHARHPDPQVLEVVAVLRTPDLRQELGMEDDLAGVRGEVLKEQPLGPGQLDQLAVAGDHPSFEIDLDVVELEDPGSRRRSRGPAQHGADTRCELVGMERLGDVVVGTEVEALRLVGRRTLGRQQDDRDGAPLPELAHDLDPVEVGHHDVEQDDVRPDLLGLLERLFAAVGGDDAEALFAEGDRDELRDSGFVVGDEDERLGAHGHLLIPVMVTDGWGNVFRSSMRDGPSREWSAFCNRCCRRIASETMALPPRDCPNRPRWATLNPMYFDEFKHQLPDIDPDETDDWIASLDQVVADEGEARARFIIYKLLKRARQLQVGLPPLTQTRYINTISPEQEPSFPGDEEMERRIRRLIRWNAVAMVLRGNNRFSGIGGHLATYASAATLYEVGFNHFFRGKDDGASGDQVFYQGHAAPGIYARAFLEGRLSVDQLDHFRRETVPGRGLSSYPHPRLMPEFWEFPTVSMGLGPISAVYQARYNRYLQNRGLADTSGSRVWAFLGDGETDEPESLGALHVASREGLDNLTFVVNCNLQRLDGPVRGNGKIIQELESAFRGAGWNVIKVIWGREWDDLLARDVDGLLVQQMNETLDGEFQRYSVESGAYIREHFFGSDPRLRRMVQHLSDDDLWKLKRGGHDYRKVYAAYKAATELTDAPTVILAKTVKGWALGKEFMARNAAHQIKK